MPHGTDDLRPEQDPLGLLHHDAWLRRLTARITPKRGSAEDLAQDTWALALRHGSGERPRALRPWLATLARNAWRQGERTDRRRAAREADVAKSEARPQGPVDSLEVVERRRVVLDAVAALPTDARDAVVLHHLEGRSVDDVAARLGVPRETVRSRLKRGRRLLRERLAPHLATGLGLFLTVLSERASALTGSTLATSAAAMKSKSIAAVAATCALVGIAAWQSGLLARPVDRDTLKDSGHVALAHVTPESNDDLAVDVPNEVEGRTDLTRPAPADVVPHPLVPAPSREVPGHVVGLDGRPFPFAEVRAIGDSRRSVTTDESGAFTWPGTTSPDRLTAKAPGHMALYVANAVPRDTSEVTIVLAPSIRLSGVVVDETGARAAGALLRIQIDDPWSRNIEHDLTGGTLARIHGRTDENGNFVFDDVPAVAGSLLWVEFDDDQDVFRCPTETRNDLRFVVGPDPEPTYPMVRCKLVRENGGPVAGAAVIFEDWDTDTDDEGRADLPRSIVEGTAKFDVVVRGDVPQTIESPDAWPDEWTVVVAEVPAPTIRGRVIDTSGGGLEAVRVWIDDPTVPSPHMESLERRTGTNIDWTDADGRFELTALPDRTYRIASVHGDSLRRAVLDDVRGGDHAVELVIDTNARTTDLSGTCRAIDGTPLAGVEVRPLYALGPTTRSFGGVPAPITTDADGRFEFSGVPIDITHFECGGRYVMPESVAVDPNARDLTITLRRRVQVRFDATAVDDEYYTASLLEPDRGELAILSQFEWIANGTLEGSTSTSWVHFEDGRSGTFTAGEGRYEAQLQWDGDAVRRTNVTLVPGELNTVVFEQ